MAKPHGWYDVSTPEHSSEFQISCYREGGKYGRTKLEATLQGEEVHSSVFDWNKWEGHCAGRLLIDDFVKTAESRLLCNKKTNRNYDDVKEAEQRSAIADLKNALAFFDKVQGSSADDAVSVGTDHYNWLEKASRKVVELN